MMILMTLSITGLLRRKPPVVLPEVMRRGHDVFGQGAGIDSLQVIPQMVCAGRTDQHRRDILMIQDES